MQVAMKQRSQVIADDRFAVGRASRAQLRDGPLGAWPQKTGSSLETFVACLNAIPTLESSRAGAYGLHTTLPDCLYPDRIVGSDRDHSNSSRDVVAGLEQGKVES